MAQIGNVQERECGREVHDDGQPGAASRMIGCAELTGKAWKQIVVGSMGGVLLCFVIAACKREAPSSTYSAAWDDSYMRSIDSLSMAPERPASKELKQSVIEGLYLISQDHAAHQAKLKLESAINKASTAIRLESIAPSAGIVRYLWVLELDGKIHVDDNLGGSPRSWELDTLQWTPIRIAIDRRLAKPFHSIAEFSVPHPEMYFVSIRSNGSSAQFVHFGSIDSAVPNRSLNFEVNESSTEITLISELWNIARWAPE